jgi:hypothetical protein
VRHFRHQIIVSVGFGSTQALAVSERMRWPAANGKIRLGGCGWRDLRRLADAIPGVSALLCSPMSMLGEDEGDSSGKVWEPRFPLWKSCLDPKCELTDHAGCLNCPVPGAHAWRLLFWHFSGKQRGSFADPTLQAASATRTCLLVIAASWVAAVTRLCG